MSQGSNPGLPLVKVKGSIIGVRTLSGGLDELQTVPSMDTDDDIPASESRQRLYSEDDEEIRMAKAMAMAIHNNPHLKPEEVQKMMEEQFKVCKPLPASPVKHVEQPSILQPLAKSLAGINTETENDGWKEWKPPLNPFANLQESMYKTQELAKQRFQEIVQGGKPVETKSAFDANTATTTNGGIAAHAPDKETSKTELVRDEPSVSPQRAPSMVVALPNLQTFATSMLQPVDAETSQRFEASPLTLSSLVWKRRSGMGKFSGNSWERRKLVVRGYIVAYYKAGLDDMDDSASDFGGDLMPSLSSADDEEKKPTWLEQAAMNLSKSNMASSFGIGSPEEDPSKPRGALDLGKEKASVCASMGHSGAPTPFCLSIKVGTDTRWKLCFDSHRLQMEWLAALTDLVVKSCVDSYNAHLLAAADPRSSLKLTAAKELWHPPPCLEGEVGTKLWTMTNYFIGARTNSRDLATFHEKLEDNSTEVEEDAVDLEEERVIECLSNEELVEVSVTVDGEAPGELERAQQCWVLRESDLYVAAAIVNAAMLFSHASSTTPHRFWHIATFANLGLYLLLSKHKPDENDKKSDRAPVLMSKDTTAVTTTIISKETSVASRKVLKVGKVLEVVKEEPPPVFKPHAGSTTVEIVDPSDSTVRRGHTFCGWRQIPPERLMVRSHGYKSTKKKVPSPGSLYDCVSVDMFESAQQCLDMTKRVVLPKVSVDNGTGPKTWKTPDLFVISVSIPIEAPASVFAPPLEDGRGYTICHYFVLREDTREILRRVTAQDYDPSQEKIGDIQKSKVNAVRLFEQWCRRAPNDPDFQARFKFIPIIANLKEAGLPTWMHGYIGKPVLIKRKNKTGYLFSHPEVSAMEFDISLHPFPYLARQAFSYLYNQKVFKNLILPCGFVVESRDDDELPECLIGLAEICYPNSDIFLQGGDLFAGTSPKSHEVDDATE